MASKSLSIKVDVMNIDKVKTLIDLLGEYIDELPEEVVSALELLADCDECEITSDSVEVARLGYPARVICDGIEVESVVSINKVLKRVTYLDGVETRLLYPNTVVVEGVNGALVVF